MNRNFCLALAISMASSVPILAQSSAGPASHNSGPTSEAKAVWAGIVVADLDVSTQWYEEKLSFRAAKNMAFPDHKLRIAFLDLNGFTLELIEFRESVSFEMVKRRFRALKDRDHLQGFVKLGFQIPNVDDLAVTLKQKGVKLRMEPTDDREFHDRFLLVDDPDGNTLQFFQQLP